MPTILTEYYPNGSLKEILDKEKNSIADSNWSPTKKYICLIGISDAMRYLHQAGVIHRDLKPQNILVDSNYYPRVCDFGLSRCFANSLTNSMQMSMTGKIGTPIYMAPELFDNEEKYGPSVDVYAFAILAYEIVTGKEPFSTNGKTANWKSFTSKILNGGRPEFTDGVKDKMKELISQCWSQNPADRPSFESIFLKLSSDFSYSEETVDEDEIHEYLDLLEESRIEAEKNDINKSKKSDEEEKKSLQIENDRLSNENNSFKEKINSNEIEIMKLQIELDKLKDEIKELNDDKKRDEEEKKNLQIENDRLSNENNAFKEKINSNEIEIKKLQTELDKSRAEIQQQSENSMKCLHIKICEARKVLKKFSKSNTYIALRLRSQPMADEYMTKTIENTVNPVWDEEFNLISKLDDTLIFNLYACDNDSEEEKIIDQLEFPVSEWPAEGSLSRKEVELKLKKKKAGTLVFEVQAFKPVGVHSPKSIDQQRNKTRRYVKCSNLKLALIGDDKVGKTKLTERYISGDYDEIYKQTFGSSFVGKKINLDGHDVEITIWDCAGAERFKVLSPIYIRGADCAIVVFDVTDEKSFKSLSNWSNEIQKVDIKKKIQVFLIGNKIDDDSNRKITYERAHDFASKNGWDYYETSAKTGEGVHNAIQSSITKTYQFNLDNL